MHFVQPSESPWQFTRHVYTKHQTNINNPWRKVGWSGPPLFRRPCVQLSYTASMDLAHCQLGCGVPFGCEAAVHAARCYLQSLDPKHLMLKFDFRNTFNTLRCDMMLEAVKVAVPE